MDKLKKIRLHGVIAKKFGKEFNLAVETPLEAVKALSHLIKGFKKEFAKHSYNVVKGSLKKGWSLDEQTVKMNLGDNELHFIPVIAGAKGGGIMKVITGVLLVGLAFASGGAGIALLGISTTQAYVMGGILLIGGLAGGSAKTPELSTNSLEPVARRASHVFNGPENTTEQGNAIPLIYGILRVGSQVISTGQNTEQI